MKKTIIILGQLLPVIISALLTAAHFLRSGHHILVAVSLGLPLILIIRSPLSVRIVQAGLLLSAVEWVRTIYILASARASMDLPWTRLAIILGAVALFTCASSLVFFTKTLKERYCIVIDTGSTTEQ